MRWPDPQTWRHADRPARLLSERFGAFAENGQIGVARKQAMVPAASAPSGLSQLRDNAVKPRHSRAADAVWRSASLQKL